MNTASQWAIAPQFSVAGSLSEGLAAVKRDGKFGLINQAGKPVI
ncbi:WG repeat-containing protein [Microcoleus sp. N9_A1]